METTLESVGAKQLRAAKEEGREQYSFWEHQARYQLSVRGMNPRVPAIYLVSVSSPQTTSVSESWNTAEFPLPDDFCFRGLPDDFCFRRVIHAQGP